MHMSGRTVAALVSLALTGALAGCGGGVSTPTLDSTAVFKARALACVGTVENQLSTGEAKAKDVQELILSLNQLIARVRIENSGATAQVAQLQALASELSQKVAGVTKPPADFKPGPADTGGCGIDKDTLKALLGPIREAVSALK